MEQLTPKVYLEIGGKKRKLTFDFNSICTVNDLTGINLLEASVSTVTAPSVRALLFASLLHDEPNLTIEEVGSWLNMSNLVNVRKAITAAWFASLSTEDDEDKKDDSTGEAQAQDDQKD